MKITSNRIGLLNATAHFRADSAAAMYSALQLRHRDTHTWRYASIGLQMMDAGTTLPHRRAYARGSASNRKAHGQQSEQQLWTIAERWVHWIAWLSVAVTVIIDVSVTFGPKLGSM